MEEQTTQGAASSPAPKSKKGGKGIILLVLVIVIIALAVIFGPKVASQSQGAVVAMVNGEKIYEEDIDGRLAQLQDAITASGTDLSDEAARAQVESQILEDLIGEELLLADAEAKGITVNEAQIDEEYNLAESVLGAEAFEARLEELGLTRESVRDDVRRQLIIRAYVDEVIVPEIQPSEEELQAMYDLTVAELPEDQEVPPFEEVRGQILTTMLDQNLRIRIQELITELRAEADVEIK